MTIRRPSFKPCDLLTAADFEAHPFWGFDTASEQDDEDADETWVRPYEYDAVPKSSDVLFAAAQIKPGSHPDHRGAVSFRFERSKPVLDGCILLTPKYCALSIPSPSREERSYLERALGKDFQTYFPVKYEAVIELGKKRFPLSGAIAS